MPKTSLSNYFLSITVQGIPFDVRIDYSPPMRGSRSRCGVPLEPDEGASVDITLIEVEGTDHDLYDILTEEFKMEAEQVACADLVQRDQEDGYDD